MTEIDRWRFESLETLRSAAYNSFNDRRGYEWKFSISLWTALAIVLAGLLQPTKSGESFPLHGPWVWKLAALTSFGLVFLHAMWNHWASKANKIDTAIAQHFRNKMHDMLEVPFDSGLNNTITEHRRHHKVGWRQPSHLVQMLVTALLSTAAVLIIHARSL